MVDPRQPLLTLRSTIYLDQLFTMSWIHLHVRPYWTADPGRGGDRTW